MPQICNNVKNSTLMQVFSSEVYKYFKSSCSIEILTSPLNRGSVFNYHGYYLLSSHFLDQEEKIAIKSYMQKRNILKTFHKMKMGL